MKKKPAADPKKAVPEQPAKKAAAEPKKGAKSSKKGGAVGGDLVQNVAGLAVPFAFILAKQGIAAMKKEKAENAKAENAKAENAKKASPKSASKKAATPKSATISGGASAQLAQLRKNIDDFLAKY